MSTKEKHEVVFNYKRLRALYIDTERGVTAGEFARYMGISRNTAKKRLTALVNAKMAIADIVRFPNGTLGYVYGVKGVSE